MLVLHFCDFIKDSDPNFLLLPLRDMTLFFMLSFQTEIRGKGERIKNVAESSKLQKSFPGSVPSDLYLYVFGQN